MRSSFCFHCVRHDSIHSLFKLATGTISQRSDLIGYQKFECYKQTLHILLQSAQSASQLNGLTGVPAHTTQLVVVYR